MGGHHLPLTPVYTGEQIRAAEKPLLDAGQGPVLMRRAAYGLAQHIARLLCGRGYGARVTGLIGSGNNGGDGLYALAFLARRGVVVRAVLVRDRAHPEALQAFRTAGGRVISSVPSETEVLIDAVLGTGFRGEFTRPEIPGLAQLLDDDALLSRAGALTSETGSESSETRLSRTQCRVCGAVSETIERCPRRGQSLEERKRCSANTAARRCVVVACDLPSGVNADTGAAGDGTIPADHTVTFGGLKQGLITGRGGHLSGRLHTVDIGLGKHLPQVPVQLITHTPGTDPVPSSPPQPTDHKYSRGVVHILAGSEQYPGAARLTVGAAVRTGVGMVILQAPETVRSQVLAAHPEVIGVSAHYSAEAVSRASCVVVGPGIGEEPARLQEAEAVLEQCLETGTACVLDASGLGLIRDQLRRSGGLNKNVLITPHLGEARQIAKTLRDRVLAGMLESDWPKTDPVEAARRIAGRLDCTVLLKGATTVIASPQGEVILHRAAAPGLATAGTGDVLSGILGALASTQQEDWLAVAAWGVSMHTAAAQHIDPQHRGRFGAAQLIEEIPHV
ncbi:NAD(P)H-hydrate dehydratase [Nesterenkonia ebinurensis]|uniref:NAD(P)H-hydrate dehydratase n=1 Tax=Nesterenkonia ebinurensis TaxID=2608252 RepID=UPI00123CFDBB|nr:NAD(P)H-hydrate dehydratase [Nesterenkonia ebinurensis]